MSEAPFDALRAAVHEEVQEVGSLAGVCHLVLRRGRCVFAHAEGWADQERGAAFGLDTLCRLHSCTKPLTAAAFFTLVDDGTVRLSDPLDKYFALPQLVAAKKTGPGPGQAARKVKSKPTLRHVLCMMVGLKYSDCPAYKGLIRGVQRREITDLASFCEALLEQPLLEQPGTRHEYSFCADVLGRVCEVASGERLDVFVRRRLLQPLGMKDTHFVVPASKQQRCSRLHTCKRVPTARRRAGDKPYYAEPWDGPTSDPGLLSGGGGVVGYADAGMWSTVQDYARFCQMLLDGGLAPSGRRVLKAATVRLFWQDGLLPFAAEDGRVPGWNDFGGDDMKEKHYWDHHAWSLLNATLDMDKAPTPSATPRRGHTIWMYGQGTYWLVDARRELVVVSFHQSWGGRDEDKGGNCVPFARAAVDEYAKR